MKLLLFTKQHPHYVNCVEKCKELFSEILLVTDEDNTESYCGISASYHRYKSSDDYDIFIEKILEFSPNLVISFSYNRVIQSDIIKIPKYAVNFHGSILPNYRGSHALNWQIVNGEVVGGVSVHELTNRIDEGVIYKLGKFDILEDDDANSVLKKVIECSIPLLEKFFSDLSTGNVTYIEQVANGDEFICKKRTEDDGEIKSDMSISQVINLSRALVHPWPGVYYFMNNQKVTINKALSKNEAKEILGYLREQ